MSSAIQDLSQRGLIHPPKFVVFNLAMEVVMGSQAYGTSTDASDLDIYGFCIPPKHVIFPHLAGVIEGFGDQGERFDQFQQAHVIDHASGVECDFTIYNIVKYFKLCADCNPNMIDSLFVPDNCVKHITAVGRRVRDSRRMFLSKRVWPRFKGYAYAQWHKMGNKKPTGKRLAPVQRHGYDVKFGYHLIRLLDEAEQILETGDLDLQRNNEQLKAVRRGELGEQQVGDYFQSKVASLEAVYDKCTLPSQPDEKALKDLLLECLEMHYGDLKDCVVRRDVYELAIRDIGRILDKFHG